MPSNQPRQRGKFVSGGIGESKTFNAPPGTFPEMDWGKLTLNGLPVAEELRHLVSYAMTDQGVAERVEIARAASGTQPNGERWPRVEFGKGPDEKKLDEFADDEDYNLPEPFAQLADLARSRGDLKPGQRHRMMAPKATALLGMVRERIEYEVVKDKNGKEYVSGGCVLAAAPEDEVAKVERRHKRRAQENDIKSTEEIRAINERMMGPGGLERSARRHHNPGGFDGLTVEDPAIVNREVLSGN